MLVSSVRATLDTCPHQHATPAHLSVKNSNDRRLPNFAHREYIVAVEKTAISLAVDVCVQVSMDIPSKINDEKDIGSKVNNMICRRVAAAGQDF